LGNGNGFVFGGGEGVDDGVFWDFLLLHLTFHREMRHGNCLEISKQDYLVLLT
jgi:hypothetical protein